MDDNNDDEEEVGDDAYDYDSPSCANYNDDPTEDFEPIKTRSSVDIDGEKMGFFDVGLVLQGEDGWCMVGEM
ncbi:hypothetical protein PanWU01x14_269870 [Parasponia andersonii]|uniref:Uncharacterized protein n=1 Tax=Parasponia andersonii TaxID=3476 RepID=A0A2P5B5I7_PARAD|nr:hypothetical protein PanWU01x14_269870 [Parasponia andersonii]